MNLDGAITQLEAEITSLGKPEVGSTQWCVVQAKSLGLSLLKKARLQGITKPEDLNAYRADVRKQVNQGVDVEKTDSKTIEPVASIPN